MAYVRFKKNTDNDLCVIHFVEEFDYLGPKALYDLAGWRYTGQGVRSPAGFGVPNKWVFGEIFFPPHLQGIPAMWALYNKKDRTMLIRGHWVDYATACAWMKRCGEGCPAELQLQLQAEREVVDPLEGLLF